MVTHEPSGFFILRSPLLSYDDLTAWSAGLASPKVLESDGSEEALDAAVQRGQGGQVFLLPEAAKPSGAPERGGGTREAGLMTALKNYLLGPFRKGLDLPSGALIVWTLAGFALLAQALPALRRAATGRAVTWRGRSLIPR